MLGATAWRVIHTSADSHYLEVCFSVPGTSQPKIAPDGAATEDTYGCVNSALISELPVVGGEGENGTGDNGTGSKDETGTGTGNGASGSGASNIITFAKTVVLPNATACFSQNSLKIKLRDPKYDPLTEVLVKLNGKKVADVKGIKRLQKSITLKKLPSGTYKVSVVATTVLNQHLSGSKTYKSCSTKGSGTIGLKRVKKHHHHG